MEVYSLQFLFMGIIFLLTTGVGLAPVFLRGVSKKLVTRAVIRHRILSCASCFGAGVFIFVCFMGLLPAADRKFHNFLEELGHTDESWEAFAEFPWGFFVVICGFLIIFTIDKLVHVIENERRGGETSNATSRTLLAKASTDPATHNPDPESNGVPPQDYVKESHVGHEHGGHGVPTSIIFLLALGVHSLFEGMAVGLQTQKEKVLEFSVAVLVHELVMAFSFGMEVSYNTTLSRWGKVLYVIIFTSTIPLGIAAGVGLQSANSAYREIVSAVLEAFATGIFIHVIFIEVLAKEFPHHHHHHHHHHDNELEAESKKTKPTSEVCLLLEKVVCICCGIATLILLSVFMHAHH